MKRLTKEHAAIIGAYTGIAASNFSIVHEYAEKKLGRQIWSHEFAFKELVDELKEASRQDFLDICYS